jgi:hypothetical protein
MKLFLKNKPFIILATVVLLAFGGIVIAWLSALYTLNHMSIKQVTTAQIGAAMRKDEFWLTYRFNTLVFDGTIQSINANNGKTTLTFVSADSYGVSCDINSASDTFKVGETYRFVVETYQAERLPNGVLLHNCVSKN